METHGSQKCVRDDVSMLKKTGLDRITGYFIHHIIAKKKEKN